MLFASWGTPDGSCTGAVGTSSSFKKGSCDEKDTVAKVKALCVGKHMCKVPAGPAGASDGSGGNDLFGDPCPSTPKRLAVVISCATGAWGGTFILFLFIFGLLYLGERVGHWAGQRVRARARADRVRIVWVVLGVAHSIKYRDKSWAKDGFEIMPHYDGWLEARGLVLEGIEFSRVHYYRHRACTVLRACDPPARTALLTEWRRWDPLRARAAGARCAGPGRGGRRRGRRAGRDVRLWRHLVRGMRTHPACPLPDPLMALPRTARLCSQTGPAGGDDALWSDEESDGDADFRTAKAILESALPELDDGEEWATDSEEEFE